MNDHEKSEPRLLQTMRQKLNNRNFSMSLLLALNIFYTFSIVPIVNFEHVIAGWIYC